MTQEPQKNNIVLILVAVIGVIGTLAGAIITVNGNYKVEKLRQETELTRIALVSIATQGGATQVSMASTISAPTSTPYPTNAPQPTYTSYPTYTPIPLPTIQPTASILLPFEDNFDSGLSDNWKTLTGTWRMVNGKLTADPSDQPSIILVGDDNWSNYVVDVDVFNYDWNYSVGIIVRASQGKYMVFQTNCCEANWIFANGASESIIAHSDERGLTFSGFSGFAKNHIHLEVNGQMYTAYIDGKLYLQVQDSSLSNGKVGLKFQYPFENTTQFDNVKIVTP